VDKSGQLTSVEERAYNPASPQSLPIPAGFKRVGDEAIFPKSAFQGYMSATGTAYWEDPETAFLLAIETFGERHPDYDKAFVRLHTEQTLVTRGAVGTRLSPGLALVSNKDGRPETEIYIPLETLPAGVDDHAYVFLIPDFNKVKPLLQYLGSDDGDKKLLFTRSYLIPYDSVKEGLLFRIYQKGILFTSTDFNLPILDYSHSLRELQMRDGELSILSRMAGDIQMTARNMKKQGDSQNYLIEGKDNPYQGKYLLEYVEARPFRYMGGRHKISEAFATWVYNGAPRVVKR
jgi:hypothetical protein